jgi:F0F1-type ATP synthase membrane subunit c/vacuolar-type H+-ATPase subunit K
MAKPQQGPQVLMILWVAMLVSHGLFLVVGHMLHGLDGMDTSDMPDLELLSITLTGVGVVTALASALVVPSITRRQMFVTAMLLRAALAESVTIFGLVLAMLGGDMLWTYVLTGLGVLAHVAAYPTAREQEAHERRRSAVGQPS